MGRNVGSGNGVPSGGTALNVGVGYGVGVGRNVGVGYGVGAGGVVGRGKAVGSGRAVGRISIAVGSGVVTGVGSGCVEPQPSFNNLIAPSTPSSVRMKCGISMVAPG